MMPEKEAAQQEFHDAIEASIVLKLPSPLKEEWIEINQEITAIEKAGGNRLDHPELMRRMNNVMLTDEFALANSQANNEALGGIIDLQWMIDTAPESNL